MIAYDDLESLSIDACIEKCKVIIYHSSYYFVWFSIWLYYYRQNLQIYLMLTDISLEWSNTAKTKQKKP